MGTFEFEIELVLQNGFKSVPLIVESSFEYDLGTASFDFDITPKGRRNYIFSPKNVNPGNYGYFPDIPCTFTHIDSGEFFDVTFGTSGNYDLYFYLAGAWDIECSAETNTGLIADLSRELIVENQLPIVDFDITYWGI